MEQLAINPFLQGLATMDKIPVQYTSSALDAIQRGEESQEYALSDMFNQMTHNEVMNPLLQEQQSLVNQGRGITNDQQKLTLQDMIRKDEIARSTFGEQQDLQLQKLLADAGEQRTKQFEQELFQKLQQVEHNSPEHVRLMRAILQTRKFLEEEQKHRHSIEVAEINQSGLLQREREAIAAGKYLKANKFSLSFNDELSRANTAIKVNAVLTKYLSMAQFDPELQHLIPMLNTMLARNEKPYAAEVDALRRQGAGGIDAGAVTGLPTRPPQPVQAPPVATPGAAQPTPTPTIPKVGEVRQGYRFKGGNPALKENWEKI